MSSHPRPSASCVAYGHERLQYGHPQQGQVLVLGMVLAAAVTLAFVHYFDAGMAVAEKARQDHAVDAAAYSGALVQARAMNMLSYINRAHAGHQVAMAHLVTLGAWAHFAGTEGSRAARGNPPAYVIAMHFGADHGAAYQAALKATGLESHAAEHGMLASAYAQHDSATRSVLAGASSEIVAGLSAARDSAIRQVLAANYPGEDGVHVDIVDDDFPRFLSAYAGNPRMRPFIGELTSLYRFLDPRDHLRRSLLPVSSRCPSLRHELRRRGVTVLGEDGRWQAVDTQSYHSLRSNRWIGCYYREYAMGWGWVPPQDSVLIDMPHVDDAPTDFAEQDFWRWVREATSWDILGGNANPLANSWAHAQRRNWAGGGLANFHDLSAPGARAATGFRVILKRPGRDGLSYRSQGSAETYFRRPHARNDHRKELPNAFHPYWQARLRATPVTGERP